jgi:hypothetical protein
MPPVLCVLNLKSFPSTEVSLMTSPPALSLNIFIVWLPNVGLCFSLLQAAVTKHHRVSDWSKINPSHMTGSPRSRFLVRACRGTPSHCLTWRKEIGLWFIRLLKRTHLFVYSNHTLKMGLLVHACNSSICEAEAGGLWVQSQPGINSESLN